MIAGQLSIFDALGEQDRGVTCPYCGHTWTLSKSGLPELAVHVEGSNGWAFGGSENGRCENQKISLFQLGAQLHFGLRIRDDEPNTTYRTDLLGAILRAKRHGCTDKQIRAVIKTATPKEVINHETEPPLCPDRPVQSNTRRTEQEAFAGGTGTPSQSHPAHHMASVEQRVSEDQSHVRGSDPVRGWDGRRTGTGAGAC